MTATSTVLVDQEPNRVPSARSVRALDWLNVFLADVRDGVGPYLAIYLLATHHWDAASIGIAMSAMGIATVIAQTPAGWLIDTLKYKRPLIVVAALLVGVSCAAITMVPTLSFIIAAQTLNGIAAAVFPPAVAAITLGLVGPRRFAARMGRNEAFNHGGNVAAAALAGLAGFYLGREWLFYLVAAIALCSAVSVFFIRETEIDHRLARASADDDSSEKNTAARFMALLGRRELLIFAVSVTLFHFANAAMLPLAGQLLSDGRTSGASLYMSACIIAAQLVMIPVAALSGTLANQWGRKPVFLIAFGVLPIRGCLYTLSDDPVFIVAVQLLDGIGAGIFGVLWVTVVADLTKGTGRYNLTLGAIATAQSIGAALSNLAAGYIVHLWGYQAGFLSLASVATVALGVFYWAMPETKDAALYHSEPAEPALRPAVILRDEDVGGQEFNLGGSMTLLTTVSLLILSNAFMTAAWYGHLRFMSFPLWLAIIASWGIAFFEYCLQVPANRIGYHSFSAYQLKTIQEVITLTIFIVFAEVYLGEGLKPKHVAGFFLLVLAAWSIFQNDYGLEW